MELADIRPIVEFYHSKLSQVSLDFKRYLYPQINWDSSVIGIMGEHILYLSGSLLVWDA